MSQEILSQRSMRLAALAAAGAVAFSACSRVEGGTEDPSQYVNNLDKTIRVIEIDPDARFRTEPLVIDEENFTNQIGTNNTGNTVQIGSAEGFYVEHDENGFWYGFKTEQDLQVLPDINTAEDEDHIIWVNEKRARPTTENGVVIN